jgi:hypothetical protein
MLREADYEALRAGTFARDCLRMELVCPSPQASKRFAGPGVIRQAPDRRLEFTIYALESADAGELFTDLFESTPGVLIPREELYVLRAKDWMGTVWEADGILPDPSSGPGGTVVRGNLNSITTAEDSESPRFNGLSGRIFGEHEIPANLKTRESKWIGDRETERSFQWRGLKLESCGAAFTLVPEPGELRVGVQADAPLAPRFDTRVMETLQFLLARPLAWDAIVRVSGGIRRTTIGGRPAPKGAAHTWVPLSPVHAQGGEGTTAYCRLFERYLRHVVAYEEDRWHPLSADLTVASSAAGSSLQTHALVLCVAVEGVLRRAFPSSAQPSDSLLVDIDRALNDLNEGEGALIQGLPAPRWSPEFIKRLQGALGAMREVRAGDQLRELARRGAVEHGKVQAWTKLRNLSAHGNDLYKLDYQELLDLRTQVLVLLHHLVFLAVGYRGPYTDYSARGWPRAEYNPPDHGAS